MNTRHNQYPRTSILYICWVLSLVAFAIAAGSGLLFRIGMLNGFAMGFAPHHIRHAHSHLMLMGWTTPALMTIMAVLWPRLGARTMHRSAGVAILGSWALAMSTFLPFLYYGYTKVPIGSANLPLAAILSGLAMIAWYAFAIIYLIATWRVPRNAALRAWDAAIILLTISTAGAWGVGALMILGIEDIFWSTLMIHFFVDLFGEGWLILGIIGVIYCFVPTSNTRLANRATALITLGMSAIYFVGLPDELMSSLHHVLASLGAFFVGLGLLGHVTVMQRAYNRDTPWYWRAISLVLALKAIAMLLAVIPDILHWAKLSGLRLVYLHLSFLGVASMGLIYAGRELWGKRAFVGPETFAVTILLMLATLVLLTSLWPTFLAGSWIYWAVLAGSILPTVWVSLAAMNTLIPHRKSSP